MLGLEGISAARWRAPVADRMLISSADGGYGINDAVRVSLRLANLGRKLAGLPPLPPPKDGRAFHFSLPGSVQGFPSLARRRGAPASKTSPFEAGRALELSFAGLGAEPVARADADLRRRPTSRACAPTI